jgi:universal stress protein A
MIPKKILFCADFSENSVLARRYALDYAKVFSAELTVVHVISSSQLGYSSLAEGVPLDIRATLDAIQESVQKALQIAAEDCRQEVSHVTTYSCIGNPAFEIVAYAAKHDIGLIVMGTHGWTGFKHLIMGSTAENVVRSAKCPVLTVRSSPRSQSPAAAEK